MSQEFYELVLIRAAKSGREERVFIMSSEDRGEIEQQLRRYERLDRVSKIYNQYEIICH